MAETKIGRLAETRVSSGALAGVPNPIKPEWFTGKNEAQLGKVAGMTQFGVNHLVLDPGAYSSLRHWHEGEDEFVFVLSGAVTLIDENGRHRLETGAFAGFPAGAANAHHFVNETPSPVALLVVGTRKVGVETIHYPDDARMGVVTLTRDAKGNRV